MVILLFRGTISYSEICLRLFDGRNLYLGTTLARIALGTLRTLETGIALQTLRTPLARISFQTLRTLEAGITFRALRTLRATYQTCIDDSHI